MSNTLLGFGLFLLVAALVGGGLKAFGFEIGVLHSTRRQIALAALGILLIVTAKWDGIEPVLFPPQFVTERVGPTAIETGKVHIVAFTAGRTGAVEVTVDSLVPDWSGFSGQRGAAGQDSIHVTICSAQLPPPCPARQLGPFQTFREEVPKGSGSISIFNFSTSPKMMFTGHVRHL